MPRRLSFAAVTVLHAVAAGAEYGFQVIDATGLPSGTVYPALSRLERDGYVKSHWENAARAREDKRPPRRYYRVTAPGVRVLNSELSRYHSLAPVGRPAKARA
ncbi:MAG: PadR family transcriptional regulator [Acidobacteriota bacterium]